MKCRIVCHGQTVDVEVEKGQSLLEAAIIAGVEPPYSCLEGICGTCEAIVESGEVIMAGDENPGRRVRTCMSRPKSNVVINFDLAKTEP